MSNSGSGSGMSSPTTSGGKSSYASLAYQYMYNAKAAVSGAFRKDLRAVVDPSQPIHCLGGRGTGEEWLSMCCRNIQYFSYRNKLPQPIGNGIDHDAGWGCMVRTGQMMVCTALQRAIRKMAAGNSGGGGGGKDNLSTSAFHEGSNQRELESAGASPSAATATAALPGVSGGDLPSQLASVLLMFRDVPGSEFGIYAIVNAGARFHIAPGEWFNATSLALSLQHLVLSKPNMPITAVHCRESTVELHEVEAAVATGKPVLVMVSVMLGLPNIAAGYFNAVHEVLGFPASVGIVGGKPKKSMYFFASQKETLFMLDPHYVQPAFTAATAGSPSFASPHLQPQSPQQPKDQQSQSSSSSSSKGGDQQPGGIGQSSGVMDWVTMGEADSSMLLCFLIEPNEAALDEWVTWAETKLPTLSEYPVFAISRRRNTCGMKKKAAAAAAPAAASSQQNKQQQQQQQLPASSPTDNDWVDLSDEDDFLAPELPGGNECSAQARFRNSFGESGGKNDAAKTSNNNAAAAASGGGGTQQQPRDASIDSDLGGGTRGRQDSLLDASQNVGVGGGPNLSDGDLLGGGSSTGGGGGGRDMTFDDL